MKKQLLFNFTKFLSQKMTFRIAAFAVLFLLTAQSSFAQKWTFLTSGDNLATSGTYSSTRIAVVKVGSEFIPYALFTEGTGTASLIKVKKRLADGTWQQVGLNLGGAGSSYGDIYADANGNLYVSYLDYTSAPVNRMAVQKYNATLDVWEPLNNDSANLYVSTDNAIGATHTNVKGMSKGPIAFDSSSNPYVAFSQLGVAYVKKYDSVANTWTQIGPNPTATVNPTTLAPRIFGAISLLIDENDVPWIAGLIMNGLGDTGATMDFFKYNAVANTYDFITGTTTNTIREAHMTLVKTGLNAGKIYIITYNTSISSKAVVFNYDKNSSTWGSSSTISSGATSYIRINSDNSGNLYASFRDTSGGTNPPRIKKLLNSSGASWTDLLDVSYTATAGIDGASGWLSMDVGQSPNPYIIYTQTSSSRPVVRVYEALINSTAATAVTSTSATAGGEVLSGAPSVGTITERGIVYGLAFNPTTADTKIADGATTTGLYTSSITGLTDATTYHVRAYFIFSNGAVPEVLTTVYGENVSFTAGTLSTDSFEKSNMVKAYPNPTTDMVTVSLPNAAVVEKIAVYNSLGQLLLTEAKNTVSLQHLAKGTYYLTIHTSEGNFAKKIIKK
jgi:hypothetical protein